MDSVRTRCWLQTPEVDLNSHLGMKLKQRMLERLMDQTLYPNDEAKRKLVRKEDGRLAD